MSWYNPMTWPSFRGEADNSIDKRMMIINGQPVEGSFDVYNGYTFQGINYDNSTKYVKLVENNFVLGNVIGKIAKSLSNAKFTSENENDKLLRVIQNPNDKQTTEEFLKEFCIYLLSPGYTMIWKKWQSVGNMETLQLINLNPDDTEILANSVKTVVDGKSETIKKIDVIFFYDVKKNINDDKGYSRIRPLRSQVKNIEDAQIAKNIQICNSGVTLISPKATTGSPIDEGLNAPMITMPTAPGQAAPRTEKDDMEDKLNSRGISNRIIVARKGVDGYNLAEGLNGLKFYEMVETDILAIYDAFGVPAELSPYGKDNTFDNKGIAESSLYENEVMPIASNIVKTFNAEFANFTAGISVSYDHVSSVAKTNNQVHETNKLIIDNLSVLMADGVITAPEMKKMLTDMKILS